MREDEIKKDINKAKDIIHKKAIEYIKKYRQQPKYLKMPLWVYNLFRNQLNLIYIDKNENLRYRNLIICETISISQLEEIEVL